MARGRTKRRSRRGGITFPLAVVAGFLPGISRTVAGFQAGGLEGASQSMQRAYLGYDSATGKFTPSLMWYGIAPLIIGLAVHKLASLLGVNRALGRARIPFIRI